MNSSNFQNLGTYKYDFYQQNSTSIKAGKGYANSNTKPYNGKSGIDLGKPIGHKKQPCPQKDCKGTIIAVMICTDVKGFETSTEQVCDTCGHVINTAMQVLGKKEKMYHTFPYSSHNDWIERNCKDLQSGIPRTINEAGAFSNGMKYLTNLLKNYNSSNQILESGIDYKLEYDVHCYGVRRNDTRNEHRDFGIKSTNVNSNYANLLKASKGRINNVNGSKRVPKDKQRLHEFYDFIDYNLTDLLEATKIQVADTKWIVRNYGLKYFYTGTKKATHEHVITCILWWRMLKDMHDTSDKTVLIQRRWLKDRILRINLDIDTLYNQIEPKLDGLKELNFEQRPLVLMSTNKKTIKGEQL
ncbi:MULTISPECIES: hypothetical protein [Methanobacterium]|uniref:Uncharacterized protein n=1 Tax=Methanobacterium bryantii TaxID=2161 RepID=A0A2A2H8Y5_METBR|nr:MULTISPECIES: hypothetical protein [Methanobacterium]OEC87873.1 hypothetical protein A9507_06775 [Methanobacterium sp. A39]PAV05740.1 hypothetical protein ASJ80_08385 [Methanobacterium bryantii]